MRLDKREGRKRRHTVEPPNNGHIGSRPFVVERCPYLRD